MNWRTVFHLSRRNGKMTSAQLVAECYRRALIVPPGMSEGGDTMGKHGDGKPADSKPKPAPDTPKHGDNSKAK